MHVFAPFCNDPNCFRRREQPFAELGIVLPYQFVTPRPMTLEQIEAIQSAARLSGLFQGASEFNVIGIASAGVLVATAVVQRTGLPQGACVRLFIDRDGDRGSYSEYDLTSAHHPTFLVDNAIVSGRTLARSMQKAEASGFRISAVITLFDHRIDTGDGSTKFQSLAKRLGVRIWALFSVYDALECTNQGKFRESLKDHIDLNCI